MDHNDHVSLIKDGITKPGGVWADFGSGSGAFTLALAERLGPDGQIYSVDKNAASLNEQAHTMRARYPNIRVQYLNSDYTHSLELPPLEEEGQFSKLSLVYLNQKVERILRKSRTKTCPYFENGECAYLGYMTASHKYQICMREFWPICKVYAFLKQSSKIIEEVNREEKNVREN